MFQAHAAHFAAEAASVQAELCGPGEPGAMARAEASFADLRAAQRFAVETGGFDEAFGLIGSIREFAMRAMRYEVFAWADVAARAPGAGDHPLRPVLTGMRSYGAFVWGEFDLAVSLAHEARDLEATLGVHPSGLAERVLANVLCIVGRGAEGDAESARQVEVAEESGNRSSIVHACYMAAVARSSVGDDVAAGRLVARARSEATKTNSPTDLASAYVAEGFAARSDDDALAAFVRAEQLATAAGNRWMAAFARTEASGLLVHRGALDEGCARLAEMVAVWYRAGEWSQQWHTLSRCVIALHRVGHTALATELVGAIEAHAMLGVAPMSPTLRLLAFETRDVLIDELGDAQAAELRAAGASRPVEDIVRRTRNGLLGRPLDT